MPVEDLVKLLATGTLGDLGAQADRRRIAHAGDTVRFAFVSPDVKTPGVATFIFDETLAQQVLAHDSGNARFATLIAAAETPMPTAVEWLRAFAWLRLALPASVQILARWDLLGPSLTQLSLDHGVSALAGPLPQTGRVRLPIGRPAPRRTEVGLGEAEVRALIVRARRHAERVSDLHNASTVSPSERASASLPARSHRAAPVGSPVALKENS